MTFLLLTLITLCGCNHNSKFRNELIALDSVLKERPDSVYDRLIDTESEAKHQSLSDRMYYELLKADAQNKAYIDFTTDSVMLIVADYYDHHGTSNDQLRAHYLLGCTYRDLKDVPMELQCFQDAAEKADTTQQDCDLYTLAAVYGQMADLYFQQYLPQEELKALKMCERIALMDKDTLSAVKSYELRLRAYSVLNNKDSVLAISENARARFLELQNKEFAAQLLVPAIYINIKKGKLDSARNLMDIFEKESGYFEGGEIQSVNVKMYYRSKGEYYLQCNKLDSAKYYFSKLLDTPWKEAAYEGLFSVYKKYGVVDSIAKYASLYVVANDSDRLTTNSAIIAQMSAMYNYTRHENENKKLQLQVNQEELANRTMLLYVTFATFFVIILVLVVVYAYKEHYRKNKQKLAEIIVRFNSLKQSLHESEERKRELEQVLSMLEDASDEVVKKHEHELSVLNERIEFANQLIDNYRERYSDVDFKVWLNKFISTEVVFAIRDLLKPHRSGHNYTADNKLWMQIYDHFSQDAGQFVAYIESEKYGLNEIDKKVIMLTVMDFGTSDIALLLDKSSNHVTNIRKRIINKMFNNNISSRKLREELLTLMKEFVTHSN